MWDISNNLSTSGFDVTRFITSLLDLMAKRLAIMEEKPGARQLWAMKPSLSSAMQMTSSPSRQFQLGMFRRWAYQEKNHNNSWNIQNINGYIISWEPGGCYHYRLSTVIVPFWFSKCIATVTVLVPKLNLANLTQCLFPFSICQTNIWMTSVSSTCVELDLKKGHDKNVLWHSVICTTHSVYSNRRH